MASAYLTRTPSSASNQKTFTISTWVKKCNTTGNKIIFSQGADNGEFFSIRLDARGYLNVFHLTNGGYTYASLLSTSMMLRDNHGFYHITVAVDTTQATASDRTKIYINGNLITDFVSGENSYPSQNFDSYVNTTNVVTIGAKPANGDNLDGHLSHFHFIDGTAYAASDFGQTDATTGIWKPKTSPSVTYGTNGFFLKFDNSGNMGLDSSGQSNNFTTNGTIIQNKDTPSNVFATMNSLIPSTITYSNGNNTIAYGSDYHATFGTLGFTQGKWYYETKIENVSTVTDQYIGIAGETAIVTGATYDATPSVFYSGDGSIHVDGTSTQSSLTSFSGGTILGVAINMDNSQIDFYINGVKQGNTATIPSNSGFYLPYAGGASPRSCSFNFGNGYFGTTAVTSAQNPDDGNGIFEYDVPAGYRALCTKSINAEEYS